MFSPGGRPNTDVVRRGVDTLQNAGLSVVMDPHVTGVHSRWPYLAGSVDERAAGIRTALSGNYGAAIASRGGYGTLDAGLIALSGDLRPPLPVVMGFSDLTALHALLNQRGFVTVHGPNLGGLNGLDHESRARAIRVLSGLADPGDLGLDGLDILAGQGTLRGRLLGGNLSVWCSMLGTGLLPGTQDAILLLEDVNEPVYRIHRMLLQLYLSFRDALPRAVLFGDLSLPAGESPDNLDYVLRDFAMRVGVPVAVGAGVGHGDRNLAVALGAEYELDLSGGKLRMMHDLYEG